MRKISEKQIISALVDIKCVGYFKSPGLSKKERGYILDTLIDRGLLDEHCVPTPESQEIIQKNFHLARL